MTMTDNNAKKTNSDDITTTAASPSGRLNFRVRQETEQRLRIVSERGRLAHWLD